MKRFLSLMLALLLVFVIGTSAVFADETTTTETTETTENSNGLPAGVDETSIAQYIVFDFTEKEGEDKGKIGVEALITANDDTLTYYSQMYTMYGQAVEETTFEEQKALSLSKMMITQEELVQTGIGHFYEEGFFFDKEYYFYIAGDLTDSGLEKGDVVYTFVFKFDDKTKKIDAVVGQQNSFIIVNRHINLINVLIVIMILAVIVLAVWIIGLSLKNKKTVNQQKSLKDEKFVSEDEVFEELVDEAGIDYDEEEELDEESEDEDDVEDEVEEDEESDSEEEK